LTTAMKKVKDDEEFNYKYAFRLTFWGLLIQTFLMLTA